MMPSFLSNIRSPKIQFQNIVLVLEVSILLVLLLFLINITIM